MASEGRGGAGRVVVATGIGVATAAVIAALASRRAAAAGQPPSVVSLDEATTQLLLAIAQEVGRLSEASSTALEGLQGALRGLAAALASLSVSVQGWPPNADYARSANTRIDALNQSFQLPYLEAPDGMAIVVRAWPSNRGTVLVGESDATARNLATAHPLIAGEALTLFIKNASAQYVSGNTIGDNVVCTVEQRQKGRG